MAGSVNKSPLSNYIGQHANSPGNKAFCYAELALSSLAIAVTIASTQSHLPTEGWPSWVGLGGLIKYQYGILKNGHLSQYWPCSTQSNLVDALNDVTTRDVPG